MGIVVVTQAISTEAHTGVLRSCGEAYINHPAVRRPPGSVRLGAEAVVAGWMHDTIDEGTWVAVGFLRAARLPGSIIPAVVIGVPRGSCTSAWWLRAAVDPIRLVRGTRQQRRGQRR